MQPQMKVTGILNALELLEHDNGGSGGEGLDPLFPHEFKLSDNRHPSMLWVCSASLELIGAVSWSKRRLNGRKWSSVGVIRFEC